MDELLEQEELPEGATMIHVGLDGVMMRMNAEKNGDEVIEEAVRRHVVSSPFVMTTKTDYRAVTLVACQKEKRKVSNHKSARK